MPAFPKPEPRRKAKDREDRREAAIIKSVRAECVDRDGYCRLYWLDETLRAQVLAIFGPCQGVSEWAHIGALRRSHTVGRPPEERHTTAGSFILCDGHHDAYDANKFAVEPIDPERGANYRLRYLTMDGQLLYEEAA